MDRNKMDSPADRKSAFQFGRKERPRFANGASPFGVITLLSASYAAGIFFSCPVLVRLAAVGKESWMGGAVSGKFENRALSGRMAMPHRSALENLPFRAAAG